MHRTTKRMRIRARKRPIGFSARAFCAYYALSSSSSSGKSSFRWANGLLRTATPPQRRFTTTTTTRLCASQAFTVHESMSDLLQDFDYDALILDQFGVLHNGKNPLEGALDCVQRLQERSFLLTVLSNTSSPAETTLERLEKSLGFDRSWFVGAVTSGEEAAFYLRETYRDKKYYFVWCTWDPSNENVPDPMDFLDLCGSNLVPTTNVQKADFVVAHGSGVIRGYNNNEEMEIRSMGSFLDDGNLGTGTPLHDLLQECADRRLPMVCANPDEVVVYHDGTLKHMPGKIARFYSKLLPEEDDDDDSPLTTTTKIRIFGKPHKEHFDACLRELQAASAGSRPKVAHVGDSLHHDVAGANAAGIPSIFVVGGIHAEELYDGESSSNGSSSTMPRIECLQALFEREGHTPNHVIPAFRY